MQKSISYNGATITGRRGTVRSRMQSTSLYTKLGAFDTQNEDYIVAIHTFVFLLTHCQIEGKLGFDLPGAEAEAAALKAGLEQFLDSDEGLYDALNILRNALEQEYNTPELLPTPGKKN